MEASFFEIISFLALPFLMCLILGGIHCYLGFHVLTRGVIFVDLSLAQVAAFGSTLALLVGFEHEAVGTYFISLVCTLFAAVLFARARNLENKVPQEAIIGITYALGSAAVVLVIDQMSHGSEHIKSLLIGQVLWVTWQDVIKVGLIYGMVGAIHYRYRRQFLAASKGEMGDKQTFWDFAFYALFGIVITSSVSIAGVLQVFAYLIVPSVLANIWFEDLRKKLLFGWLVGMIVSLVGMSWSYAADLPSGAAIVVCFTVIPLLLVFITPKAKSPIEA
jgi:zinc/manganese transport system permease protein